MAPARINLGGRAGAQAGRGPGPRAPPSSAGLKPATPHRPPCKGEHPGFAANARALVAQDYPGYEVLFVVDDADDPCARALAGLAGHEVRFRVLRTDPAFAGEAASGKIAAMRTALAQADARSEVLVFADADARPPPGWLACLVAPLADPRVGGTTGYRWYHAEGRATPWTALRDGWNAVGLDALTTVSYTHLTLPTTERV